MDISMNNNDDSNDDYDYGSNDYDDLVVKKSTVRYKFVIVLFILCISFFHPESFNFTKDCFSIENINVILFIHSCLLAMIIYFMLKYSDDSLVFSPCNIEIDLDDYIYYTNQGDNQI